jgi:hypothetical protein
MTKGEGKWQEVHDRVQWWITDMAFKPNEVITEHYFNCMAQDIADTAVGEKIGELTVSDRLDPPRSLR